MFFAKKVQEKEQEKETGEGKEGKEGKMSILEGIEVLNALCEEGNSKRQRSVGGHALYNHTRLLSVRRYLQLLSEGKGKMEASLLLATSLWNKGSYLAACIRKWAKFFLEKGELPEIRQGKHQKVEAMVDDEDFHLKCQRFLRELVPEKRSPAALKGFIEGDLFPSKIGSLSRKVISEETCRPYMRKWEFTISPHLKDVYIDGHERADVRAYRQAWASRMP